MCLLGFRVVPRRRDANATVLSVRMKSKGEEPPENGAHQGPVTVSLLDLFTRMLSVNRIANGSWLLQAACCRRCRFNPVHGPQLSGPDPGRVRVPAGLGSGPRLSGSGFICDLLGQCHSISKVRYAMGNTLFRVSKFV